MKTRHSYHDKQHTGGFVLPFVVALMVVMILIGFGMLSLGYDARAQALRHSYDSYAVAAAEAGIVHMVSKMNTKLSEDDEWDNTTLYLISEPENQLPNSPAQYKISVVGNPYVGFVITSTGTSGTATRTFYAMTLLRGVFDYGILVKDELKLYENCSASGYNSKSGQTGLPTILATAKAKDGLIDLKEAFVNGNVLVGPFGNPDKIIDNPGTITGTIGAMDSAPEFPKVSVPSGLSSKGSIEKQSITLSGSSGSGRYDKIQLEKNDILEISGDTILHVTGDVVVKDNAEIRIRDDGASSLTLYVDGKVEVVNRGIINNITGKPENLRLFGSANKDQNIKIETAYAGYNFYGVVYAPNAKVTLKVDGDLYGSFVSDKFELKSESAFYHDRSVTQDIDQQGVFFGIGRWYEP